MSESQAPAAAPRSLMARLLLPVSLTLILLLAGLFVRQLRLTTLVLDDRREILQKIGAMELDREQQQSLVTVAQEQRARAVQLLALSTQAGVKPMALTGPLGSGQAWFDGTRKRLGIFVTAVEGKGDAALQVWILDANDNWQEGGLLQPSSVPGLSPAYQWLAPVNSSDVAGIVLALEGKGGAEARPVAAFFGGTLDEAVLTQKIFQKFSGLSP